MKLIRIFFIIFISINIPNISYSISGGSGPLKFSERDFQIFLAYLRGDGGSKGEVGKKKGTPGNFFINQEGTFSRYTYCPIKYNDNCVFDYGKSMHKCSKYSKQQGYGRCYLFAKKRKIVWDGKDIRIPKKWDQTYIESIFKENGWYGSSETQTSKSKKQTNQITGTKKNDTVEQLKKLNEMFKSGALSEEEFTKAKKKILD